MEKLKNEFLSYIQTGIAEAYERAQAEIDEAREYPSDTADLMIQSAENGRRGELNVLWNACISMGITPEELESIFPCCF